MMFHVPQLQGSDGAFADRAGGAGGHGPGAWGGLLSALHVARIVIQGEDAVHGRITHIGSIRLSRARAHTG